MSWVQLKLTGKWTEPDRMNPWKDHRGRSPVRVTEASNAAGWAALGRVMKDIAAGGPKRRKG